MFEIFGEFACLSIAVSNETYHFVRFFTNSRLLKAHKYLSLKIVGSASTVNNLTDICMRLKLLVKAIT